MTQHTSDHGAHTPGPWKIIGGPIQNGADISIEARRANGNPQYIGRVYNAGILAKSDPEAEANARLIAAAPETAAERDRLKVVNEMLLAELEHAAAGFAVFANSEHVLPPARDFAREQIRSARAAIRAAKGESE